MSQPREEHHTGECSYVFEKVMRPGERGVIVTTEVTISDPVNLGLLAHILRQANAFDQKWRSEIGMNPESLKRIGTT